MVPSDVGRTIPCGLKFRRGRRCGEQYVQQLWMIEEDDVIERSGSWSDVGGCRMKKDCCWQVSKLSICSGCARVQSHAGAQGTWK